MLAIFHFIPLFAKAAGLVGALVLATLGVAEERRQPLEKPFPFFGE